MVVAFKPLTPISHITFVVSSKHNSSIRVHRSLVFYNAEQLVYIASFVFGVSKKKGEHYDESAQYDDRSKSFIGNVIGMSFFSKENLNLYIVYYVEYFDSKK